MDAGSCCGTDVEARLPEIDGTVSRLSVLFI